MDEKQLEARIGALETELKELATLFNKGFLTLNGAMKADHSILVDLVKLATGRRPAARSGKVAN